MFATLLGPLPRPPLPDDAAPEAVLDAVLALQLEHGLEPLIGVAAGRGRRIDRPRGDLAADRRRGPTRLVKAVVLGPISAGRPAADVRAELLGLADAGCAWIEVHEPAGDDDRRRSRGPAADSPTPSAR